MRDLRELPVQTKNLVVTQANSLVYSSYEMTLQEKRLLLLVISMIRKDDNQFHTYHIPVKSIQNYLGIDNKNVYSLLKEITKKLLSRVIHIEKENGDYTQFQWLSRADYISQKSSPNNTATLELRVHEDMRPLLLELKSQFGSFPFLEVATLPSYHSIRIFEILWHNSLSLRKRQFSISLVELKNALRLEGKYSKFRDFRKYVLDKAKEDCQAGTPLCFKYEAIKVGRSIKNIRFTVWQNKDHLSSDINFPAEISAQTALEFEETREAGLVRRYRQASFRGNVESIIKVVGLEGAEAILNYALERQEEAQSTNKPIRNLGGFIRYLLKNDKWQEIVKENNEQSKRQEQILLQKESEALFDKIKEDFNNQYDNYLLEATEELAEEEKSEALEYLEQTIEPSTLALLKKFDYQGPAFDSYFHKALIDTGLVVLPPKLESLEAFVELELNSTDYTNNSKAAIKQLANDFN